jgi:hypothetical protein
LVETLVTLARMDLELWLADGRGTLSVRVDEHPEGVELAAFNVNFDDVDKCVTWHTWSVKISLCSGDFGRDEIHEKHEPLSFMSESSVYHSGVSFSPRMSVPQAPKVGNELAEQALGHP